MERDRTLQSFLSRHQARLQFRARLNNETDMDRAKTFSALALIALVALPTILLAHEDAVVAVPYDELWRRTNQTLLLLGFAITSKDKDTGIVTAEIPTKAEAGWFTACPKGRGTIDQYGFSVSILINVLNDESTGIRVAAQGLNTWKQVDHYGIFKKRFVTNTVRCTGTSNGEAEKLVLSYITGSKQ